MYIMLSFSQVHYNVICNLQNFLMLVLCCHSVFHNSHSLLIDKEGEMDFDEDQVNTGKLCK